MTELTASGRRIVVVRCGASRNVAGRPSNTVLTALPRVLVSCAASDAQRTMSNGKQTTFRMVGLILSIAAQRESSNRIDIGASPRRESQNHRAKAAVGDRLQSLPGAAVVVPGVMGESGGSRKSPTPAQHLTFPQSTVAFPNSS